jgi:peptidoglycan hydrolase-like protein with peptidoglycan-binding domain
MNAKRFRIPMALLLLALAGCVQAPLPTATPAAMPTSTPAPTSTPPPATSTPPPPAYEPDPVTITVGAHDCDFVTIQDAIDDAGTSPGDVITVIDPVHTEAGITVDKDVVIQGLGAGRTAVQGHTVPSEAPDGVFVVPEGATATIKGMTIRHGHPPAYPYAGGGIANFGALTVEKCVIRDNSANEGGGIFNQGLLTVTNCTISGNTADKIAPPGYECGSGGGVKNGFGGTLALTNCTLSGNHAVGKGGGLFVACEGQAVLTNCTISGNQTEGVGGGLFVKGGTELMHCTVSENASREPGGGIYVRSSLDFTSSIVANNEKEDIYLGGPGGFQGKGVIGTNVNNWVGDGSCPSEYCGDPMLGPLADNGGDTPTHALLPGSPAIDLLPAPACRVPADQRGEPRLSHISSLAPICDLGAFERQP